MSVAYQYSISDSDQKDKEVKGVLSIEGEELLFEYKLYDASGDSIGTLNKFSLLVDYLKNIHFKKGFFSSSVVIDTEKEVFLNPLPGNKGGRISLSIDRENRKEAQQFAEQLSSALNERRK